MKTISTRTTTKAELADNLADLFFELGAAAKRSIRRDVESEGLTLPQATALSELVHSDGRLSARALGQECHMLASTATGVIDRLEQHGYVRRERDSADRRVVWISLTSEGAEVAARLPRLRQRVSRAFAALPSRDIENMRDLVQRVLASMSDEGGR